MIAAGCVGCVVLAVYLFLASVGVGVQILGDKGGLFVTTAVGFATLLVLGVAFLGLWAAIDAVAHADPPQCPWVSVHRTACDPAPQPPVTSAPGALGWWQEVIV